MCKRDRSYSINILPGKSAQKVQPRTFPVFSGFPEVLAFLPAGSAAEAGTGLFPARSAVFFQYLTIKSTNICQKLKNVRARRIIFALISCIS